MKVVDIHPEELIDKLNAGSLTPSDRERLDLHLAQCSACRFEIALRDDLEQDAPLPAARPQLSFGERPPVAPRAAVSRVRRRRWPLVALAAALVLCAGGATAAVVAGSVSAPRWLPWVPREQPSEPLAHAARAKSKAKPASVSVVERAEPVPSASAEPVVSATVESSPAPAVKLRSARPAVVTETTNAPPASTALAALPAEPVAAARVDPAATLFADANRARRDGNAERAVALYRSLQSRYPSSAESELSRALLAQLLLERGSPEAALAGFDRYLAEGAPVLGAEAWVGRARALEQLGKSSQAIAAWQTVQTRFPGSVHARLAATRLAALGER